MIGVQAGVAGHLLHGRPDAAEEALRRVRTASRTTLEELATMLRVLRRAGGSDTPTEHTPSLDRLDALIENFSVGQPVRWTVAGRPRALPLQVDAAAYRIIQESLTNAHKHAPGAAVAIGLHYRADSITIEVRNDDPDPPDAAVPPDRVEAGAARSGTGLGLIGMRERVRAAHGALTAGPQPGGGWLVRVALPHPETANDRKE